MDRKKKLNVKKERPETSRSRGSHSCLKDGDLSHFIHDRVELLQQAFSVLKPQDIKAIAPKSIKDLPYDKVKELCLEELLGISSKRLNSVLAGTEPPSDTESSDSSDRLAQLDTISLESISSDEADLSPKTTSQKSSKKKKCKNKSKHKKEKKKKSSSTAAAVAAAAAAAAETERARDPRGAGLTVLELLELQARARAIKAQLLAEQQQKDESRGASASTSSGAAGGAGWGAGGDADEDDDVLIKEEPQEVVELSSSDEEPALKLSKKEPEQKTEVVSKEQFTEDGTKNVSKRNDLTIIVSKPNTTNRRIKLKRNYVPSNAAPLNSEVVTTTTTEATASNLINTSPKESATPVQQHKIDTSSGEIANTTLTKKDKKKKKTKRNKKSVIPAEKADNSDQDEISLQLSDSEKMDLLEHFHDKSYETASSSNGETEDCSSSETAEVEARVSDAKNYLVSSTINRAVIKNVGNTNILETPIQVVAKVDDTNTESILTDSKPIDNRVLSQELSTTLIEKEGQVLTGALNKRKHLEADLSKNGQDQNEQTQEVIKISQDGIPQSLGQELIEGLDSPNAQLADVTVIGDSKEGNSQSSLDLEDVSSQLPAEKSPNDGNDENVQLQCRVGELDEGKSTTITKSPESLITNQVLTAEELQTLSCHTEQKSKLPKKKKKKDKRAKENKKL